MLNLLRAILLSVTLAQSTIAQQPVMITHGPILGRPGAHEMGVWARTSQPGAFRLRYGVEPNKLDQTSAPVTTSLDHDNTGWTLLKDLQANTKYFVQVVPDGNAASNAGPSGSFRTLPDARDFQSDQ